VHEIDAAIRRVLDEPTTNFVEIIRIPELDASYDPSVMATAADAPELIRRTGMRIAEHIAQSVDNSNVFETPFYHITLNHVFPNEVRARLPQLLPELPGFRQMPGGTFSNRLKFDLLPEYIRQLSVQKRMLWDAVARALRSRRVKDAIVHRLAPALQKRFGDNFEDLAMYCVPTLIRDFAGYSVPRHTGARSKAIVVELNLCGDDTNDLD
jgi:hypothetical protein